MTKPKKADIVKAVTCMILGHDFAWVHDAAGLAKGIFCARCHIRLMDLDLEIEQLRDEIAKVRHTWAGR